MGGGEADGGEIVDDGVDDLEARLAREARHRTGTVVVALVMATPALALVAFLAGVAVDLLGVGAALVGAVVLSGVSRRSAVGELLDAGRVDDGSPEPELDALLAHLAMLRALDWGSTWVGAAALLLYISALTDPAFDPGDPEPTGALVAAAVLGVASSLLKTGVIVARRRTTAPIT